MMNEATDTTALNELAQAHDKRLETTEILKSLSSEAVAEFLALVNLKGIRHYPDGDAFTLKRVFDSEVYFIAEYNGQKLIYKIQHAPNNLEQIFSITRIHPDLNRNSERQAGMDDYIVARTSFEDEEERRSLSEDEIGFRRFSVALRDIFAKGFIRYDLAAHKIPLTNIQDEQYPNEVKFIDTLATRNLTHAKPETRDFYLLNQNVLQEELDTFRQAVKYAKEKPTQYLFKIRQEIAQLWEQIDTARLPLTIPDESNAFVIVLDKEPNQSKLPGWMSVAIRYQDTLELWVEVSIDPVIKDRKKLGESSSYYIHTTEHERGMQHQGFSEVVPFERDHLIDKLPKIRDLLKKFVQLK